MNAVKHAWSAFNHWRKRHWLLRVIILCLFFAYAGVDAWFLPTLVRVACDAILADAEPKMADAIYRSNKANEVRRLQAALMAKLDKDEDGTLDEAEAQQAAVLGLDSAQLSAPPLQADLQQIVAAARRAHLIPASYTAPAIRRDAWRAAQAEVEETMAPEHAKISSLTAWWRVPDYTSPTAWKAGLSAFYRGPLIRALYGLIGNPFHWIPFFVSTALVGSIVVVLLRGGRITAAVLTAVVIWGGIMVLWAAVLPHSVRNIYPGEQGYWLCVGGDFLLILAVAAVGVRLGARNQHQARAWGSRLLVLGILFLAWGLLPTPGFDLRLADGWQYPYLMNGEIMSAMKLWIALAGVAVLGCLAAHAAMLRSRRGRSARRPA